MGRKPKPNETKRRAGNPGRRPLNDAEPVPVADAPPMPEHLSQAGRDAWAWLCEVLGGMGILASSDVAIMTLYCDTWSQYVEVRGQQASKGVGQFLASSEKGLYIHPLLGVESMLKKQLVSYIGEMGLTATSRVRLHAAPKQSAAPGGKGKYFKVVG